MLTMSTLPPSSRRRASRKNKASWRKNVDIADVEDELDDQRLEERLGGAFRLRRDDELFVIDSNDKEKEKEKSERESCPSRLSLRKSKWGKEKALKCFSALENTSAIKDPKKGRNRTRSAEERRHPIVKAKELRLAKAGIVKKKVRDARRHRLEQKDVQQQRHEASKKRYRTDFDFDLWSTPTSFEAKSKLDNLESNEWVSSSIQTHLRNNMGLKMMKKAPSDLSNKPSLIATVQTPHPGASYNPSFEDHQQLLWEAIQTEVDKERKKHKLDYHTTRMFPKPSQFAAIQQERIKELSQGIKGLDNNNDEEDDDGGEDNDIDEQDEKNKSELDEEDLSSKPSSFKLKTKQKRRRLRSSQSLLRLKNRVYMKRKQQQELFRLKSLRKAIAAEEKQIEEKKAKRQALKEHRKLYQTARLGQLEFEEGDLDLKLSNELRPDLRSLAPEGSLLEDHYRSLQRRNIIEPRVKQKRVVKYKRKRVEKRSYKMDP